MNALDEKDLHAQLDEAKLRFLREKPQISTMLARLHAHSASDATAILYFETIQEYMQLAKPQPVLQQVNDSLMKAIAKYPAIKIGDANGDDEELLVH